MGHHAKDIPCSVAHSGNIFNRSVWVCFFCYYTLIIAITEHDLIIVPHVDQVFFRSIKPPFAMCDRYFKRFCPIQDRIYRAGVIIGNDVDVFCYEFLPHIMEQGSGQQPGFTQNLKSVTHTEDISSPVSKFYYAFHDGRIPGNGTGP